MGHREIKPGRLALAALGVFFAVFLFPTAALAETTTSLPGYLRVTKPSLPILIDDASMRFKAGASLPMLQENDRYLIAVLPDEGDLPRAGAFRATQMGRRHAWITSEAIMYFAYETSTCKGFILLDQNEELPILSETQKGYDVLVSRFHRKARLWIPKKTPGLEFMAYPPRRALAPVAPPQPELKGFQNQDTNNIIGTIVAGSQTYYIYRDDRGSSSDESSPTLAARIGRLWPFSQSKEDDLAPAPSTEPPTPSKLDSSALYTKAKPAATTTAAVATAAITPPPVVAAPPQKPAPSESKQTALTRLGGRFQGLCFWLWSQRTFLLALLGCLTLSAILYDIRQRRENAPQSYGAIPDFSPSLMPLDPIRPADSSYDIAEADLAGALSSMSLGSLAQLLSTESETGVLTILDDQRHPAGTMIFVKGEMIDAKTSSKRGVEAVYEIVRNKTGTFTFKRGPGIGSQRTVHQSTMPLILDAYRMVDERAKKD